MSRLPFNVKFRAASRYFAAKVPMKREDFDRLADWAKTRAFTVASVTKAKALNGVMEAVQQAIDEGLSFDDFREVLDDVIGVNLSPWHAETVYRTNLQSAYGSGRLQQQREQREDFPFIQIHEVDDDRTRASHRARDGVVLALSDARVRRWYPPSDFGCRGHAESLSESEARTIGISPIRIIDAEDDSTFTGPGYGDEPNLRGMLRGLDPTLSARVRKAIEDFDPSSVDD